MNGGHFKAQRKKILKYTIPLQETVQNCMSGSYKQNFCLSLLHFCAVFMHSHHTHVVIWYDFIDRADTC